LTSVTDLARAVLDCPEPMAKVRLAKACGRSLAAGTIAEIGLAAAPPRPARPTRPRLCAPRHMARRRAAGSRAGRIALYHALAHIELNAIDLAWDIVARFTHESLPRSFYDDWVTVAGEEARHFGLVRERLAGLGAAYGDLPAHDGLWQAAEATADDLGARLAVVPLVLEARGLDVTPAMIAKLRAANDGTTADILEIIYQDEIGHVRIGQRWFAFTCAARGLEPESAWRGYVATYFKGGLKPPFNTAARDAAGMPESWYAAEA